MRKLFLLLLFLFLAAVLTYLNRQFLQDFYLQKFYPWLVRGEVKDITNGSLLELTEIKTGERRTFTTYKGEFSFKGLPKVGEVYLISPDGYEAYDKPLSCQVAPTNNRARELVCQALLYPTVETVATRVETAFFPIGREVGADIEGRYRNLWKLSAPESQRLFKSEQAFVDLLVIKDLLQRELKINTIGFKIWPEKTRKISNFREILTGMTFPEVVEVAVDRVKAGGKEAAWVDRFVKIDGVWRYLLDFTQRDLEQYNSTYGWVLKKRVG